MTTDPHAGRPIRSGHPTEPARPAGRERLTRRECLARSAGAAVAAGIALAGGFLLHDPRGTGRRRSAGGGRAVGRGDELRPVPNFLAGIDLPASTPRLSIATGDAEHIAALVRAAVAGLDPALGIRRFIARGDSVLIKPNIGFDRPPQLGATTHPEVVRALIRLCREAGAAEVRIADHPIESPAACLLRSGIQRVADEEGARIVRPTERSFALAALGAGSASTAGTTAQAAPAPGPRGAAAGWPVLYEPLAAATRLIGAAPIKDHNLAGASMLLKNWYGLLGGRRHQLHQSIHETIGDLAALFSPTLVIADGTRVMLRNGPTGGRLSDVRPGGVLGRPTVVAAVDPVACDAWCCQHLLGRDPAGLEYLRLAQAKIAALGPAGRPRLGEADWRTYDRAGLIAHAIL